MMFYLWIISADVALLQREMQAGFKHKAATKRDRAVLE